MKLAVSNILWQTEHDAAAYPLAATQGAQGIEVAPTRIAAWDALTAACAADFRIRLSEEHGLQIPAMQAILYGCQGMELLGSESSFIAMAKHLQRVAQLAQTLGAHNLVFGAPKCRRKGHLSYSEAFALAAERLHILAQQTAEQGVTFVLEAVTEALGCDFITTTEQAAALVRAVDHHGLRLHLDTGTMIALQEKPEAIFQAHADIIAHLHISRPDLGAITAVPEFDLALDHALCRHHYKGWVSIEIMPRPDPLTVLTASIVQTKKSLQHFSQRVGLDA